MAVYEPFVAATLVWDRWEQCAMDGRESGGMAAGTVPLPEPLEPPKTPLNPP